MQVLRQINQGVNSNKIMQDLNNTLFNDAFISGQNSNDSELLLKDVITNIMDNIQLFRASSKKSAVTDKASMQTRYANATQALAQIRDIINSFQLNTKNTFVAATLYQLDNLFKKLQNNNPGTDKYQIRSFGTKEVRWIIHNLNNIQGGLLEALGTEFLEQRVPQNIDVDSKALNTGNLQARLKSNSKYTSQIIQDIMILDMTQVDLNKDVQVSYTLNKKKYTTSLSDFLNKIEKATNSQQFVLSDTTYELLESLSILNVQAKSGKNQPLWNINKMNQVKLEELTEGESAWGGLSGAVVFQILEELNEVSIQKGIPYIATPDNGRYSEIANYALSSRLGQLLNFGVSQAQNQVLLTRKGFQPYLDAVLDQIGTSGYIHFIQAINIERGMGSKGRNVSAIKG